MTNQEGHNSCCSVSGDIAKCPVCKKLGKKVSATTLDNHIPKNLRKKFGHDVGFCTSSTCEVVYYQDSNRIVRKGETKLPVTIKDLGDDVYVCYCFEFTRGDIRQDLKKDTGTDIHKRIKEGIQAGRCNCELKNPQGTCCLGNVNQEIKVISSELKKF